MANALALALLLSLVPSLASAQSSDAVVREIEFWEDMRHKIEDLHHLYIPVPGGGYIISPEQETNLFSYLILTGQMSPQSIVAWHQQHKAATQVLLQAVKEELSALKPIVAGLSPPTAPPPSAPVPPTPPYPTSFHAEGEWSVTCFPVPADGVARLGETFLLDVRSDGLITGTFAYGRTAGHLHLTGTFGADGTIMWDRRDEATVTVTWGGQLTRSGSGAGTIRLDLHNLTYTGTCDGRWWTSDRPRPVDL